MDTEIINGFKIFTCADEITCAAEDVGCRILHFMNCIIIYGAPGKKAIFRGIIKNSVSWHLLV